MKINKPCSNCNATITTKDTEYIGRQIIGKHILLLGNHKACNGTIVIRKNYETLGKPNK